MVCGWKVNWRWVFCFFFLYLLGFFRGGGGSWVLNPCFFRKQWFQLMFIGIIALLAGGGGGGGGGGDKSVVI